MSIGIAPKNKGLQKLILDDYFQTTFGGNLKNKETSSCFVDILKTVVEHAHGDVPGAKKTLLECNFTQLQVSEAEKVLTRINENYEKNILVKIDVYIKKLRAIILESGFVRLNNTQKSAVKAIPLLSIEKPSSMKVMTKELVDCFNDSMSAVYEHTNVSGYFTTLCSKIEFTNKQAVAMNDVWEFIYKLPTKSFEKEARIECMKRICRILNFQYCSWYTQDNSKVGR
jgi:hypothetical protein